MLALDAVVYLIGPSGTIPVQLGDLAWLAEQMQVPAQLLHDVLRPEYPEADPPLRTMVERAHHAHLTAGYDALPVEVEKVGNQDVLLLIPITGQDLLVTPDQEVHTRAGWKRADQLVKGLDAIACRDLRGEPGWTRLFDALPAGKRLCCRVWGADNIVAGGLTCKTNPGQLHRLEQQATSPVVAS